jgi:hypothetical protein
MVMMRLYEKEELETSMLKSILDHPFGNNGIVIVMVNTR